jgi:hypothetical protein
MSSTPNSIPTATVGPTHPPQSNQANACWWRVAGTAFGLWLVCFGLFLAVAPNFHFHPHTGDTPYGADFLQEWVGARLIYEGRVDSLYETNLFQSRQHDRELLGFEWSANRLFPPVYPPMHYAAFVPLALISYRWAALLWLGFLIACALVAAFQIETIALRYAGDRFDSPTRRKQLKTFIWLGLLLFPMVLFSTNLGQKSVIWLVILTSTWQLLLNKRDLLAGLVFGLLSLKPTLFFLLPLVLLSRGKFRFFLGASLTVVVIWGSGLCLFPAEAWLGFLREVGGSSNYPGQNGYRLDWSCNLLSLAYAVPTTMQSWVKQSVCAILALYCLFACFERRNSDVLSPENLLMTLAATFLLSPHAYSYDLCLFLLPIFWIYSQQPRAGFTYYALLIFAIAASGSILTSFDLPILPILLMAIVVESRLRYRLETVPANPRGQNPRAVYG